MRKLSMAELNRLTAADFQQAPKIPIVVVLDDVRSMHNVGAIFRSADAFAVERIILGGITPTPPHRDIHKTALGAEDTVSWIHTQHTAQTVAELRENGYQIVVVEQVTGSVALPQFVPATGKVAIVLGNEVEGVSQAVMDVADVAVEIPQFGTKHSLNVSVAAGVVLYQLCQSFVYSQD